MKISTPTFRLTLLALVLLSAVAANAAYDPELPLPPNKKLSLTLLSPISTATGKSGDKFGCKVLSPVEYAGAIVEGHIRSLKRSGKANKDSKIDLAFDKITMPNGRTANFSATVIEVFDVANAADQGRADNEGVIATKPRTLKMSVKRAAAGAAIGGVIGGLLGGGQGAAIGMAIGASVGVTTTMASRGPDLEFRAGTQFTLETSGQRKKPSAPKGIVNLTS